MHITDKGMNRSRIIVAGIGPGSEQDITPAVMEAVAQSDVIDIRLVADYDAIFPWFKPLKISVAARAPFLFRVAPH